MNIPKLLRLTKPPLFLRRYISPHPVLLIRAPRPQFRLNSTTTTTTTPASATPPQNQTPQQNRPSYELTFTCRPCGRRSNHIISHQAYHTGTVLVTCPGCSNRHVITDHLKIFSEKGTTLEELLKTRGEAIKKGRVLEGGDIELLPPEPEPEPEAAAAAAADGVVAEGVVGVGETDQERDVKKGLEKEVDLDQEGRRRD